LNGSTRIQTVVVLVLLTLLFGTTVAKADMGPKPEMNMALVFQGAPIAIVSVDLLECTGTGCKPIQRVGPQYITCATNSCYSRAYGYSATQKLVITFADRVRESNLFTKRAFSAHYTVTVTDTGLIVDENLVADFGDFSVQGDPSVVIPPLLLTIIIETIIAGLYLLLTRQPKRVLVWVPIVNLITVPIVWWFVTGSFPFSDNNGFLKLPIAEIATVIFEAVFLHLTSRKVFALKQASIVSVLMNLASFLIGFIFINVI